MGQGMIQKLVDVLMNIAQSLGVECACAEVERIAVMVHRIMSYQSRQFHTLEHVFGFQEGADAITMLAAIFHDVIYRQVDGGLPPETEAMLAPFLVEEAGGTRLSFKAGKGDRAFELCRRIFGIEDENKVYPPGGLNEFLSALAMAKIVQGHFPEKVVIAVMVCIEASIPFRGTDAAGRTIGEALEGRIAAARADGFIDITEQEGIGMVRRAMTFANVDVKDFADDDPAHFLSNTWKLLPESNAPLRNPGAFSIREYRIALQKMLGFFRFLRPANIYHSFRGVPDDAEMKRLEKKAAVNLLLAENYLKAKLLAIGLLEAISSVTGGDVPVALFMGDIPSDGRDPESLADFLAIPAPVKEAEDDNLYLLLKDGRLGESSFDLRNSPLALYLYMRFSPEKWERLTKEAEAYFSDKLPLEDFLERFGDNVLKEVYSACGKMVPTRLKLFQARMARLK